MYLQILYHILSIISTTIIKLHHLEPYNDISYMSQYRCHDKPMLYVHIYFIDVYCTVSIVIFFIYNPKALLLSCFDFNPSMDK